MNYCTTVFSVSLISLFTIIESVAQEVQVTKLPLQLIDDVKVASLDPGIVKRVAVKQGDIVKQGDLLLQLDSDLFEAEVSAQEANCLVASADARSDIHIRFSEKSLALNESILKKSELAVAEFAKSVSQSELGKLRLERDQAALGLEKADADRYKADLMTKVRAAELATAKIRLGRRSIQAPSEGVVVSIEVQAGEAVSSGQPVVRIVNLDKLRLVASIDGDLVSTLSLDTTARFELFLKGVAVSLPAKIVFISPEIRFTDQSFDVWVEVDNSERKLLPGLKGTLLLGPPGPSQTIERVAASPPTNQ